ncbi:cytochrome P450 2C11-like [Amphiura filiformis]|uniref:cytochrome P450 2C11-like n=1 Tax=Amphiura filiformis TaxID=82378 RepID=UPI003B2118A9
MDAMLQVLCLLLLILIIIVILQYYRHRWPVANFPPGPTGLPIIGTALFTGSEFHFNRTAKKFMQSYDNVCSLMLDVPAVLVNGYEAINEVTQSNKGYDFASRKDPMYSVQLYNPKKLGLFTADFSERWQKQRRFALSTLRGFGFGKTSFEEKITREVETLLSHVKELAKVPQDLSTPVILSVASVMCDTILGCHYDHNDKDFQHIVHVMEDWFQSFGKPSIALLDFVPISRPFLQRSAQEMRDVYTEFSKFTMSKVAEHQKTFVANQEPRDFIDCYLAKMVEDPDTFTLEELKYVLSDLFSAAADTTSNTLRFAILYMMVNPDVQEKVHQELMQIVGPSRLPKLEDRDMVPYTVATIHEIQRLSCIAPGFPRCATVDTTLAGYSIPKGTNVICNIWGLHYDPDLWPDPYKLDPTRHLNDKGEVIKSPYLLPFGAGKCVCAWVNR